MRLLSRINPEIPARIRSKAFSLFFFVVTPAERLFLAKQLTPLYNFQRPNSYGLAIQRFNASTIQRFNNSTVQQFNSSTVQQFNSSTRAAQSTIQRFNNSTVQRAQRNQQFNARSAINNSTLAAQSTIQRPATASGHEKNQGSPLPVTDPGRPFLVRQFYPRSRFSQRNPAGSPVFLALGRSGCSGDSARAAASAP
jgi:hypothetical protein